MVALAIGLPTVLAITGGGSPSASGAGNGAGEIAPTSPPPTSLHRSIRLAAVGDTVMGSLPYGLPSHGGRSLFTAVKPLLHGDVVLGNFEGTFATGGSSKCGPSPGPNCFAFHTPPSYARWLRDAGFTVVTLANNHADDFGPTGRAQTRATLARAGVRGTGWPGSIAYLTVAGGEVAVVGFAFNNVSNNLLDIPAARALVAKAAARAPVVIVTDHAGAEGSGADRVRPGTETSSGRTAATPCASPTPSSTRGPTSSSATDRTSCAASSSTKASDRLQPGELHGLRRVLVARQQVPERGPRRGARADRDVHPRRPQARDPGGEGRPDAGWHHDHPGAGALETRLRRTGCDHRDGRRHHAAHVSLTRMRILWETIRRWIRAAHLSSKNLGDHEQIGAADLDATADDLAALPVPEPLCRFDSGRPQPDWADTIHRSRHEHRN